MPITDHEGFLVNDEPELPDPPYVDGDHAATCVGPYGWGCERCNPSDDERARQADIGANLPAGYVDTLGSR